MPISVLGGLKQINVPMIDQNGGARGLFFVFDDAGEAFVFYGDNGEQLPASEAAGRVGACADL